MAAGFGSLVWFRFGRAVQLGSDWCSLVRIGAAWFGSVQFGEAAPVLRYVVSLVLRYVVS